MAETQTCPRRLFLSPRLRLLCSLWHPQAPVSPALPPSLQVRFLCPHLFQRTAHLAVLRLSLPATSSANLPVVVGGSCDGATGTESSIFPNLNKAFLVGPGYAPVPYKLFSKITAGHFVDLADLLTDNIRAQEIEPQAFLEEKLVVSGSKKRVIEIADIVTWIEAFTILSMVLCHTFPSRWKDLNQYKLLYFPTARRFSDKSWLHYDIAFRKEAAALGLSLIHI